MIIILVLYPLEIYPLEIYPLDEEKKHQPKGDGPHLGPGAPVYVEKLQGLLLRSGGVHSGERPVHLKRHAVPPIFD